MSAYKVEICGVNTSRLPILKEEEKDALFARIKQGDEEAREIYIKGNLRLVLSVIRRFSGNHENVDDLFQIGCIGLIKSIDNFDPTMGVKFSTYAVPMIVGEIRRYLRDNNSIRVSRSLRDTAYKAIHAREILSRKSFKEPTLDEIAKEAGVSISTVSRIINGNSPNAASKEMQDKIWRIARAGGYVPNTSAQALRQKSETSARHQSIACIYARSQDAQNDAFFSALTRSIEQEALKEGYIVKYSFFHFWHSSIYQ